MLQLEPRENYTIVRKLDDPNDSDTYYVRAFIRNSKTDALLDTVDLTDKGEGRFTGNWQVVADTVGLGIYIDITTRVYTDSGYTVINEKYADRQDQYLVLARYNPVFGNGSGGGRDIDYKKVRKIVQEEIAKIPPVEIPAFPKVNIPAVVSPKEFEGAFPAQWDPKLGIHVT